MPTVCSETCIGRIRYLGVLLYDADRIEAAASAESEEVEDAQDLRGECGFSFGNGCSGGESTPNLFGGRVKKNKMPNPTEAT